MPSLYAAAMIARIWRGYTTHANAEAYAAALQAEILPGIMACIPDCRHPPDSGRAVLVLVVEGKIEGV